MGEIYERGEAEDRVVKITNIKAQIPNKFQ